MSDLCIGSMVVEDSGNGTAVVMVHGLGGTSNSFETLVGAMDTYRVLRPDLPGAGRSAMRPGLPGIAGMASAVRECVRAAGVHRTHFVGHSMGTLVCQHIAAMDPDAVMSLTLFGPMLEPPPAARQALKERASMARSEGMAGIADAVSTASVAPASREANPVTKAFVRESLMRQSPAGYASHCEALSEAHAAEHDAIRCPTLLVVGTEDPVTPVAMAEELRKRIDGARLETVPGVAHWIMVEAPGRSIELLCEHLEST